MSNISFIIPSINRQSLHKTIASIEPWEGDEILVEFDLPPSGRWGNDQRNNAMVRAKGDYLAFIDDDDEYCLGHRRIMQRAIEDNPGYLNLFKMQYPNGDTLWQTPQVIPGNIGSPMILVPNDKKRCYHWKDGRNMADFIFVDHWQGETVWREEIIAYLGHDGANYDRA
jgi:glycosyltransferase involved in cell wall biosynthesis